MDTTANIPILLMSPTPRGLVGLACLAGRAPRHLPGGEHRPQERLPRATGVIVVAMRWGSAVTTLRQPCCSDADDFSSSGPTKFNRCSAAMAVLRIDRPWTMDRLKCSFLVAASAHGCQPLLCSLCSSLSFFAHPLPRGVRVMPCQQAGFRTCWSLRRHRGQGKA